MSAGSGSCDCKAGWFGLTSRNRILPKEDTGFRYKPCTIGTLVPAATVSITGKRECGTYNEALEAKWRRHTGRPYKKSLFFTSMDLNVRSWGGTGAMWMVQWLERGSTDRKVRGSNPNSESRLLLSRLGLSTTLSFSSFASNLFHIEKSLNCSTLSVPNCHATSRRHDSRDAARLPKPRQGKRRDRQTFQSVNSRSDHLIPIYFE
ncbi:hypothetical protein CSKR_106455 [Clonorchis sinensis]|uniref:Uncharacterized protein n=1 Tax=Clonorchis sinensis TaxID=79923 RepID=A0A3R7FN31_CLOSI|nr:hypothetical protein CSKR_106455 [Clonorchis sinensis]